MKTKILFLDIETAPNLGYIWGKYEQNVIEFNREWYLLCCGYRWKGGKTKVLALPDYPNYSKNRFSDKALVKDLFTLLDEAQIVVAHNGDQFDLRKINARMSYYGIPPPSPYKTVDTLKVARKFYGFTSNKLNDLGLHLKIGAKKETGGFETWKGCMAGDPSAWKRMIKYNRRDVDLLVKVHDHFLPWITNYPKIFDKGACDKCGSQHLCSRGSYINRSRKYQRLKCSDCGGWQMGTIIK